MSSKKIEIDGNIRLLIIEGESPDLGAQHEAVRKLDKYLNIMQFLSKECQRLRVASLREVFPTRCTLANNDYFSV